MSRADKPGHPNLVSPFNLRAAYRGREMDFFEGIEPLHELPSDELEDNLNNALESLKLIWTGTAGVSQDADFYLQTLIYSIKKSLGFFYPDLSTEISEMADAGTALFFRDCWESHSLLKEGGKAIASLYLQTGATGCEPQGYEAAVEGFHIAERQVFKLAEMARHYFHERTMKEATPLINEGVKAKQRRSKGGRAPKKAAGVLLWIENILQEATERNGLEIIHGRRVWDAMRKFYTLDRGESQFDDDLENLQKCYRLPDTPYSFYFDGQYLIEITDETDAAPARTKRMSRKTFLRHFTAIKKSLSEK